MSYRLEADETLPEGLKRIAREQLDDALAHLAGEEGDSEDERVHEARKSLKKVRAVIRLVRDEVGEDVYQQVNVQLRDAGRLLSDVRDAQVLSDTLERLREQTGPEIPDAGFARISSALDERRDAIRHRVLVEQDAGAAAAAEIADARGRIDAWPIDRADAKAFRSSLQRTYARGRDAMDDAYGSPGAETFHEWRKRAKYLWYHARILCPAAPGTLGELVDRTDQIGDLLGLDHDYAVLVQTLSSMEVLDGDDGLERSLRELVERRRFALQREASPLGLRVYAEKPGAFARRVAAEFEAWRLERHAAQRSWFSTADADRIRGLLAAKLEASAAEQRQIRAELRERGLRISDFESLVPRRQGGFGVRDFNDLVARGVIGVGDAGDLPVRAPGGEGLREVELEVDPNEGSGLCPLTSEAVLEAHGWGYGFWVALDDTSVAEGLVALGHARLQPGVVRDWEAQRLATEVVGSHAPTDDAEDCVRRNGRIYAFGSHYGAKEGPLEHERQFVARFRERDAASGVGGRPVELEVAHTDFRLHRAVNDALAAADVELFDLSARAREALVGATIVQAERDGAPWADQVHPDDLPINIEGVANRADGGLLLGLRFPVSAAGEPLLVELAGVEELFDDPPKVPKVRGVWVVAGVGNPAAPAGVRGLTDRDGASRLDLLTGNLDSVGKDSVLVAEHPEAGRARSAHFELSLPGNRHRGRVTATLVREFPGLRRVEGVATDPVGRTFYVTDEDERIHLRYVEPGIQSGE